MPGSSEIGQADLKSTQITTLLNQTYLQDNGQYLLSQPNDNNSQIPKNLSGGKTGTQPSSEILLGQSDLSGQSQLSENCNFNSDLETYEKEGTQQEVLPVTTVTSQLSSELPPCHHVQSEIQHFPHVAQTLDTTSIIPVSQGVLRDDARVMEREEAINRDQLYSKNLKKSKTCEIEMSSQFRRLETGNLPATQPAIAELPQQKCPNDQLFSTDPAVVYVRDWVSR